MTLNEFIAAEKTVEDNFAEARRLQKLARDFEAYLHKSTGLYHQDRGPDHNQWTHAEIDSWHSTPRKAFEALLKKRNTPAPLEFCI